MLTSILLLTEVFATINTIDEGYPLAKAGIFLILFAGASQIPGLFVALWRWKTNSIAAIPMIIGAYVISLTGTAVYAKYAFDGQADSMQSAAHMHVIAFPVLHCIFAVAVYLACGTVTAAVALFLKLRRRDQTTTT